MERKRKKVDNRIRIMIENGVAKHHRSMFVIVGDQGKDQVVVLHQMLSKAELKARPSVLWCYKKELGFSSHPKKRMKEIQKKIKSGKMNVRHDDQFDLFLSSTNIRYCYYAETHKILGNTYGMCVLQDFEALTPNLLARTVETVEGGGMVIILLRTMSSLKQLFTMSMDVHARFRTEDHQDIVGRFNERFLLSLSSCKNCVVLDDKLHLIPISTYGISVTAVPTKSLDDVSPLDIELTKLKKSVQDIDITTGKIIKLCRTIDQAQGYLKFVDAIVEQTLRTTVVMTAARGRGKSAALGLALSAAVAFGYSNMFVTAPSPENLKTLFEFIFKGFEALDYQEHIDYDITQSTNPEFNKAVVKVTIFRDKTHHQTIQYIHPADSDKLGQAELVCIDEAAAIPLPVVKKLLGPYLVFMSSTVNGYEGTGRSLSLKLIEQLRQQCNTYGGSADDSKISAKVAKAGSEVSGDCFNKANNAAEKKEKQIKMTKLGRVLHEIELKESIRYANGDPVEAWLNRLLCLDVKPRSLSEDPLPSDCQLHYVNRDSLFSYHPISEKFLHQIMALYVSSDYKNSPNDLQILSDAPAHHIFVLLGPVQPIKKELPDVLCVLQVCLEGEISKGSLASYIPKEKRASDLIPWTVSQQFQDTDFLALSGARVVRIATHPDCQRKGYGTVALDQLQKYFEEFYLRESMDEVCGNDDVSEEEEESMITEVNDEAINLLNEYSLTKKKLPPLLIKISDRKPEKLQYLGVSFGLTSDLYRFWKKNSYVPVYLRHTPNDLTGEHSCIMLKTLNTTDEDKQSWLQAFWKDFHNRFVQLLSGEFQAFNSALTLEILENEICKNQRTDYLDKSELLKHLTADDVKILELYSQTTVDFDLVEDLLSELAILYFTDRINFSLTSAQKLILVALGLQYKSVEEINIEILDQAKEIICKFVKYFKVIFDKEADTTLVEMKDIKLDPLSQSMKDELTETGLRLQHKKNVVNDQDLSQLNGSQDNYTETLTSSFKSAVSDKKNLAKKRKLKEVTDKNHIFKKKTRKSTS